MQQQKVLLNIEKDIAKQKNKNPLQTDLQDLLMFHNIQNTYKMMHFKYLNNLKKLVFQASRRSSLFFMQEEEISCLGTKKNPQLFQMGVKILV